VDLPGAWVLPAVPSGWVWASEWRGRSPARERSSAAAHLRIEVERLSARM